METDDCFEGKGEFVRVIPVAFCFFCIKFRITIKNNICKPLLVLKSTTQSLEESQPDLPTIPYRTFVVVHLLI